MRQLRAVLHRNAIALLALFVALGGTSYAAVKLPRNSVASKQVKDRSLLSKDFKAGQLPRGAAGAAGAAGPVGAAGPAGPPGAVGPAGKDGAAGRDGVDGAVGQVGATGAAGPSYGRADTAIGSGSTPPTGTGLGGRTLNVNLPRAGRLQVSGSVQATGSCTSAGPCTAQWGIYLDGAPVRGTGGSIESAAANGAFSFPFQTLMAVTPAVVAAGPHVVEITSNARTGALFQANFPQATLNVVLLGAE